MSSSTPSVAPRSIGWWATNDLLHWQVTEGEAAGWSYIRGESGNFFIREVYRGPDGSLRYTVLPLSET